jgi:DNA-binding LacI/PurR family transcriptional regulator
MGHGPDERRHPAMVDVAALAGVSHQTVSRVLNGHPNVREQTRIRVVGAIDQLGYRPNQAAKALVTGRSQTVGVVAQSTTLYGPAALLSALETEAARAGFAVNVASVRALDRASIAEAVNRQLEQRVAGIVVIAPVTSASDALDRLRVNVPLVAVDGDPRRSRLLVTVDQVAGAKMATWRLLAAGHETVWHVCGPPDWFDSAGRAAGWQAALREAGRRVPPPIQADWSAASGYRAGSTLAGMHDVTAVLAANDHIALGLLRAFHEKGKRVPRDVSVVGFDDLPDAAFFIPPLTTIRPDFAEVARRTLAILLDRLTGATSTQPAHQVVVPILVERASVTGPLA